MFQLHTPLPLLLLISRTIEFITSSIITWYILISLFLGGVVVSSMYTSPVANVVIMLDSWMVKMGVSIKLNEPHPHSV